MPQPHRPPQPSQNNLLILGCGRSGTSLLTGLFRGSGLYLGDDYIDRRAANPTGFYEDSQVNRINDALLARQLRAHRRPRFTVRYPSLFPAAHVHPRLFWLAAPRRATSPRVLDDELAARMRQRLDQAPFCYKDPRFSVTLPVWRSLLPVPVRFLVIFRSPQATARSILRELKEGGYPEGVDETWCHTYWRRTYHRLLHRFADDRHWMFLEFGSVVDGSALPAVERFTGWRVDGTLLDANHSRSGAAAATCPARCRGLLAALQTRSRRDIAANAPADASGHGSISAGSIESPRRDAPLAFTESSSPDHGRHSSRQAVAPRKD